MRYVFVLLATVGCRAELGGGGTDIDAPTGSSTDAPKPVDAGVQPDAPVDARPCTGGDASGVAPDGTCFVHFFAPKPYAEAKLACEAIGGHLAYLEDASMDAFAETFVGARDTFIGLTDLATEMAFVWDDGTPVSFTAWHAGEPNDGDDTYDEDCGIIAGARVDKMWDDRPCAPLLQFPNSGSYSYLCQY